MKGTEFHFEMMEGMLTERMSDFFAFQRQFDNAEMTAESYIAGCRRKKRRLEESESLVRAYFGEYPPDFLSRNPDVQEQVVNLEDRFRTIGALVEAEAEKASAEIVESETEDDVPANVLERINWKKGSKADLIKFLDHLKKLGFVDTPNETLWKHFSLKGRPLRPDESDTLSKAKAVTDFKNPELGALADELAGKEDFQA